MFRLRRGKDYANILTENAGDGDRGSCDPQDFQDYFNYFHFPEESEKTQSAYGGKKWNSAHIQISIILPIGKNQALTTSPEAMWFDHFLLENGQEKILKILSILSTKILLK